MKQWNALNAAALCSSSSAYRRFREWCDAGVFLEFWQQGLLACDAFRGKEGTKRSTLTDAAGIPLAVEVNGANRHDMKLTRATLAGIVVERPAATPEAPQGLCRDKAYDWR